MLVLDETGSVVDGGRNGLFRSQSSTCAESKNVSICFALIIIDALICTLRYIGVKMWDIFFFCSFFHYDKSNEYKLICSLYLLSLICQTRVSYSISSVGLRMFEWARAKIIKKEKAPKRAFIMFYLLQGHPRGHFWTFE